MVVMSIGRSGGKLRVPRHLTSYALQIRQRLVHLRYVDIQAQIEDQPYIRDLYHINYRTWKLDVFNNLIVCQYFIIYVALLLYLEQGKECSVLLLYY